MTRIEVNANFFGKDISIDEYSRNALEWGKIELVPIGEIYCQCINRNISISTKNLRHTIYHKKSVQKENFTIEIVAVISKLKELIENATHRYSGPDKYGAQNVLAIHSLKSHIKIDGINRDVELTIKEIVEGDSTRCLFYNHIFI